MMKKFITAIILVLLLCVPFTGAYALDMLHEDFEVDEIDSQKWTADFRGGPTSGITVLPDGNKVMQINGTFNPRTQAQIEAGKDYRHAMLRAAALNPGTTNPLKISFDIKIDDLGTGSKFQLNFTSGSNRYTMLDFLDSGDIKVGYRARQDGGECFAEGEWYTVSVEHKPSSVKPFTVTITPHDPTGTVITKSYDLDRIFSSSIKTQVVASGINVIDFMASGVGAADSESKVNVSYDNIRVETMPVATQVAITGDAFVGKTLTASYTPSATYYDDITVKETIKWYSENGDEDTLLGEGGEYTLQKTDAGKQLYVVITPTDSSGYWGAPATSELTDSINVFAAKPNESLLAEEIEFGYGVDAATFDGAVILTPTAGGEAITPVSISAVDTDSKVIRLEFAEGALSYGVEYTITISEDAKYKAEENEEAVSCSGTASFTTREAPGIVIAFVESNNKEGIIFQSKVKLSTAIADYEQIEVYACLIRNDAVIKTNSFLMDVDINTEYELSSGFIVNPETDKIKWFAQKENNEMSNALTVLCQEVE